MAMTAWGITFIGMMRELAYLIAPMGKRDNVAVLDTARHEPKNAVTKD